eukprot:scaffold4613_cov129-Isochrysis_galbana.AAC.17
MKLVTRAPNTSARLSRSTRCSPRSSACLHHHCSKPNMLALLSAGLTVCGCSLFDLHSLERNEIGDTGAQHIGEALKINKTLTTLMCAPSFPPQAKMRSLCCQHGLTVCGCSLFGPHSLMDNKIGNEGAQHIGEALKTNKALTSLKYAPALPIT